MARANVPFLAFNRGLVSPKALARIDLDRTRLSAEVYNNWLPKTQGAMTIRPGTKFLGSSLRDTGAAWVEFVASTQDVALPELTPNKMRIWLGEDAHALELLARPAVDAELTLSDTGWINASTGGGDTGAKVSVVAGTLTLNAVAIGSLARREKRVIVSDTGVEHSLAIVVTRGPVVLRVGTVQRADDYIGETSLGVGAHNLAFTPTGNFWVTLQSDAQVARRITSCTIGDSGTVEITTPWGADDLDNVRYDQSADVVYVDCVGIMPQKIERRGTGRSWSVVDYAPTNGPFLPTASSSAKLQANAHFGNAEITTDRPFFAAGHLGALFRIFHEGQSGLWYLGDVDAVTDAIEVTGLSDTGAGGGGERTVSVSVAGSYTGTVTLERSINGVDLGFHPVDTNFMANATAADTGTFSRTISDPDDNFKVWYRARLSAHTSGMVEITITYQGGGINGIARVTVVNSATNASCEILKRFSSLALSANWQQGYWSPVRGFPTAPALHGGRLAHAQGGSVFLSVADDYENFNQSTVGDAGPIIRTLGSGPVDNIYYLVSLLRLIIGTAGSELTLKSSSLDEPVTPDNSSAGTFSTQGSANVRALKMDTRAIFVQRSRQRVFMVGAGAQGNAFGDYESFELSLLVPDLLSAGVVSVAIQRQPDTRLHCVLGDGTVAILTYEPQEEVICWTTWSTDGLVEKAMCLPGLSEDAVFYHIRRTINGATKRYLEKWAMEAECLGDTGLSFLADCAISITDTGRSTAIAAPHLAGKQVIVWANDTGSVGDGKDLSPDVDGVQTTYLLDTGGGVGTLSEAVHHKVIGLGYQPTWKSTKLAYAAEAGTALSQKKRVPQSAFSLYQTHNNGLFFGSDTGHLDPLPRMVEGALVDPDTIHPAMDAMAIPFPGTWDADARMVLRGKAPRPATILATVPSVQTNEKV